MTQSRSHSTAKDLHSDSQQQTHATGVQEVASSPAAGSRQQLQQPMSSGSVVHVSADLSAAVSAAHNAVRGSPGAGTRSPVSRTSTSRASRTTGDNLIDLAIQAHENAEALRAASMTLDEMVRWHLRACMHA